MKIFVLSDLHAFYPENLPTGSVTPSFLDLSQTGDAESNNPLRSLQRFVEAKGIKADVLICCGDLADRANPKAFAYAWAELHKLKRVLDAGQLFATAGNHDIDSRHQYNDHDAKGFLMEASPNFPFEDEVQNNQYWAQHFNIIDHDVSGSRFLIINSAGYHGSAEREYEHGRIAKRTLGKIEARLRSGGARELNIVVCHHHPHKHSELDLHDYDDMKGGYEFLRMLNPVTFGPWLVIHGHKHHPKISYAHGSGGSTPVVFSSGSCAAIAHPTLAGKVRNQCYLIEPQGGSIGASCLGTFTSYEWVPSDGWNVATINSGLPAYGGFGYRGTIDELGKRIEASFPNGGSWRQLTSTIPDLRHTPPDEIANLGVLLEARNYHVEWSKGGYIHSIEK